MFLNLTNFIVIQSLLHHRPAFAGWFAKARLNDTYNLVSSEGVQMHGGIGMTDEYEIGFFMKRSRVCEHTFGNSAFHRNRYGELQGY